MAVANKYEVYRGEVFNPVGWGEKTTRASKLHGRTPGVKERGSGGN